jgi:hypothetical protein
MVLAFRSVEERSFDLMNILGYCRYMVVGWLWMFSTQSQNWAETSRSVVNSFGDQRERSGLLAEVLR